METATPCGRGLLQSSVRAIGPVKRKNSLGWKLHKTTVLTGSQTKESAGIADVSLIGQPTELLTRSMTRVMLSI